MEEGEISINDNEILESMSDFMKELDSQSTSDIYERSSKSESFVDKSRKHSEDEVSESSFVSRASSVDGVAAYPPILAIKFPEIPPSSFVAVPG